MYLSYIDKCICVLCIYDKMHLFQIANVFVSSCKIILSKIANWFRLKLPNCAVLNKFSVLNIWYSSKLVNDQFYSSASLDCFSALLKGMLQHQGSTLFHRWQNQWKIHFFSFCKMFDNFCEKQVVPAAQT